MLFRNSDGKLVEIKKNDYTNDTDYYKKIMMTKEYISKQYNYKEHIFKIVNNTLSKNI